MNLTQVPISMIDTASGDAGKVLTSNGSTLNWVASSSIAPSTGIVAWVNFNGAKDTTGAASTANTNRLIRASSNVTSVLRNGTGDYTINFTNALASTNYAFTFGSGTGNARLVYLYNGTFNTSDSSSAKTTTSIRILYGDTQSPTTPMDSTEISVCIIL